jgi:4-amino-4-deoxy-L-arabinose transferase-like glycosyltransferase
MLIAACLFAGLALVYALTRSHWLDDWDSVNLALGLDDFDVGKHQPHPPGYPIHVAAAKLLRLFVGGHAAALTLVSALTGAAVATMFYLLVRRQLDAPYALGAALIMALTPLFWLQSGLALTDMFGMVFVLAFLLAEGAATESARGDLARRIACGVIAGLSLGARPHYTLLILAYWCIRGAAPPIKAKHVITAVLAFAAGVALWLIPASTATGGAATYLVATIGQFNWRFGRPGASVLGTPVSFSFWFGRLLGLIGSIGQAYAPMHLPASEVGKRTLFGLLVVTPYVLLAWRSPSKAVARPYMLACAVYLLMIFIMLPVRNLRYFLPFSLIVGWAVPAFLLLFRRPAVRMAALVPLLAVTVLPSFFVIGGLTKIPPPVAALDWIKANSPGAVFYASSLHRHATFYWPEGGMRHVSELARAGAAGAVDQE